MKDNSSLWEIYLEECDPETIPRYRMKNHNFENLDEIIHSAQENNLPTVRFILKDDYLNHLEDKKLWLDQRDKDKYYALVVTNGGKYPPLDVRYIKPLERTWGSNVHSVVKSLSDEGREKAIVVGGYAKDCVLNIINEYLAKRLEVVVPHDALQESERRYNSAINAIKKSGAKTLPTKKLLEALKA
jgi:nicotinamidase-related amidase